MIQAYAVRISVESPIRGYTYKSLDKSQGVCSRVVFMALIVVYPEAIIRV